jgi:multidrug transporter EmrE-like cation transporter
MSKLAASVTLVIIWVALATWGDTLLKTAPRLGTIRFAVGGVIYFSCAFLAFWTYRLQGFGWVVLLWNSLSLALSLLLSVVVFQEPFTIRRRIATILVLAAILLTE